MKKLLVILTAALVSTLGAQDLVRVPANTYEVADQITSVKLRVSVPEFLLGATEVIQLDYEAITGVNPSFYKGADRPVENAALRSRLGIHAEVPHPLELKSRARRQLLHDRLDLCVAQYGQRFRLQDVDDLRPIPSGILTVPRLIAER